MASEIRTRGPGTGSVMYSIILGSGTSIWSTSGGTGAFESYSAANWTSYAITLTETGAINFYRGDFPAAVPAGVYDVASFQQAGGSPATSDRGVSDGEVHWNGAKTVPLSDLVTSGMLAGVMPLRLTQGHAISGFPVYFRSAADHVTPMTSGVCSGQISRNGAAFTVLQSGAFSEVGNGFYKVNLTSGDLNALVVSLLFTANGASGGSADPVPMSFLCQRGG